MNRPAVPTIKRLRNVVESTRLALDTAKAKVAEAEHRLKVAEEAYSAKGGDKAFEAAKPARPLIQYDLEVSPAD